MALHLFFYHRRFPISERIRLRRGHSGKIDKRVLTLAPQCVFIASWPHPVRYLGSPLALEARGICFLIKP